MGQTLSATEHLLLFIYKSAFTSASAFQESGLHPLKMKATIQRSFILDLSSRGVTDFFCCFVLANLFSSVKVKSGFQVNQNICFLCEKDSSLEKRWLKKDVRRDLSNYVPQGK